MNFAKPARSSGGQAGGELEQKRLPLGHASDYRTVSGNKNRI